jgi:hypothetical protein
VRRGKDIAGARITIGLQHLVAGQFDSQPLVGTFKPAPSAR